jgi:transposase
MKFIQGNNRNQTSLFPITLDEAISSDNQTRIIDLFVDSLKLEDYGFKVDFDENGRPAYHPSSLLKLYIYGYMNKVRSSRGLEKECGRNIEVMWLLHSLCPDHNTISNFRRDNSKAIKKVFRATVSLAKHFELIGGELIAGDSTKLRAQNGKKNNFNQNKIDRHLAYIEEKLEQYNKELAENDGDKKEEIGQKIQKQEERKTKYKRLEQQLQSTGKSQISTSDPDSRQLVTGNGAVEVVYNVQTTVDSKHKLPIDYKVTNENDKKAMGNMLRRAKSILGTGDYTALYDKGYHTGSELYIADTLGIKTLVAIPALPSSSQAPDIKYNSEYFIYNKNTDTYQCPEGQLLSTNGTYYTAKEYRFKQYKSPACRLCKEKEKCTKSLKNGKLLQRSEYAESIENNKCRMESGKDLYKLRQAIVEHPYGTIKRQWGFSYILTKKYIHRASADVGIMMTAYNLRRIINILGIDILKEYLQQVKGLVFYIFKVLWLKKTVMEDSKISINNMKDFYKKGCIELILGRNFIFFPGF